MNLLKQYGDKDFFLDNIVQKKIQKRTVTIV